MILSNDVSAAEATVGGCSFWSCLSACLGPCAIACAIGDSPLIPIVDIGTSIGAGAAGDTIADILSEPQAM